MSDFGLQSDDFHLDLNPDDVADPEAVFGHDALAGYGTAGLSEASSSAAAPSGDPMPGDAQTVGYDSDGDGVTDVLLADENHDGIADVAMWDSNHDGLVDEVAYDQDHDGKIDLIYHDDDFDGHVDRVETLDGTQDVPGYTSN
jgi:hypothetical protein